MDGTKSEVPPPSYDSNPNSQPPPQPVQPGYGQPQQGYGQPQQGYGQPMMMTTGAVVQQPATQVVIVNNNRGPDCLTCSILNLIFCNLLFGAIAVAFSCMARDAYDRGDSEQGRSHYKVAMAMNIVGPLVTVGAVLFVIIYFVAVVGSILG